MENNHSSEEIITNEIEEIVTLTMDDNTEVHCDLLGIFEAANGLEYIALLPIDGPEAESGQVYIYRYSEAENEEPVLENIPDDAEFELAAEAFDEMMADAEFEED